MSLSIKTHRQCGRETVIALHGEVDYATALELRAAITSALRSGIAETIVVDLAGVTFLDSTGVGTLVVAARICAEVNVQFQVIDANPFIVKLFTVVGVAETLGVPPAPGVAPRAPKPRADAAEKQVA